VRVCEWAWEREKKKGMTTLQNNIIYKAVLFCVCFAAAARFAGAAM